MGDIYTAWELIGFDGTTEVIDRNVHGRDTDTSLGYEVKPASVRIVGGRALYESVSYEDSRGGRMVKLLKWGASPRYVDPDTKLELIEG